ncbi:hypothetical protein [Palleronia rufa]|uniref:hypothetical protein n=1 Tax=Palleronia rufa TaxID=1530186 RepID=UPI0005662D2B|nr:hypothetical protein [Palleronia rufa]
MIRFSALIALVSAWALAGAAQGEPVLVRTAEHDGFTRIVIDYRDRPDWQIVRTADGFDVRTSRPVDYDLGGVYRRIGDRRIEALRQSAPDTLAVSLNCPCDATPLERPNGGLILDIAAGPPAPERASAARFDVPDLLPGLLVDAVRRPAKAAPADFSRSVMQSFRDAAAEGLIDAIDLPAERVEDRTPLPPPGPDAPEIPPGLGIRVESQEQRDESGRVGIPAAAICPPYARDPLSAWSRVDLPADADSLLTAETDARRLISRGLGAEALSLLRPVAGSDPVLQEIAAVVDAPVPAPRLAASADCGDAFALFALIAGSSSVPARIDSIVNAVDGIGNETLRQQLGRRAAARLRTLRQPESARVVENRLAGVAQPARAPETVAAGRDPALLDLAARRTPDLADAMVRLVDGMVDRNETVPVAILDQAQALSVELTGRDRDRLDRSVIRARIASGALTAADGDLVRLAARDADLASRLRIELFGALLDMSDDAGFLKRAVRLKDRLPDDQALRVALAARAESLHVPDLALDLLGSGREVPSREERLLRSRIALSRDAPDAAESFLAGLSGPDVDALARQIAQLRVVDPAAEEPAPPPNGLQARSAGLLAESAALREEIRALIGN